MIILEEISSKPMEGKHFPVGVAIGANGKLIFIIDPEIKAFLV